MRPTPDVRWAGNVLRWLGRAVRFAYRRRPLPRQVTVYTGATAEHYPTAETWRYNTQGDLDVFDRRGRLVATFIAKTWLRVEVGPYVVGEVSPQIGESAIGS